MAYQTAVNITSLDGLLADLVAFAVANAGFTHETGLGSPLTVSGRPSYMYILSKGGMYWWFLGIQATDAEYGDYGRIEMRMMKTAPTVANREALYPTAVGQRALTCTFLYDKYNGTYLNYHMFADPDSKAVHCAIEVNAGVYSHLSFGVVKKYGTYTGGEYVSGSDLDIVSGYGPSTGFLISNLYLFHLFGARNTANGTTSYLYYPYESIGTEKDWSAFHMSALTESRRTLPACTQEAQYSVGGDMLHDASPNATNNRSAMFPVIFRVYDNRATIGTLRYILVGHVPGARIINCSDISPTTLVDTDWMVFPQYQKSGNPFDAPVSGLHGIAFKK